MSNSRIEKLMLILQKGAFYVLAISILGETLERILFILNLKNIEDGYGYVYALLFKFILIFIYKHKYWIISCVLLFISDLLEIAVFGELKLFENTITYWYYDTKMIVSVIGIVLLLIALFYCLTLWRKKDYADHFVLKNFKVH